MAAPEGINEQSLDWLRCFDTMFVIDDSAHMAPYWGDVQQLIEKVAPICAKHDPDGIDLYFVNHKPGGLLGQFKSVRKTGYTRIGGFVGGMLLTDKGKEVSTIFTDKVKPAGKCHIGARLGGLLEWYVKKFKAGEENAALNLIVLTAGAFDDDIKAPIVHIARELDAINAPAHQVGIQLFRLGGPNVERQKTFEYLDDELYKEAKVRDIVDTVTYRGPAEGGMSSDDLLKVVLGAVVNKLDTRSSELQLDGQAPVTRAERD
ncbi:hypothetical protein VPNG_02143 [Cytospora leucostoma]|uniref:VWFA domain-containing protein n=1 Tax=Cytospora leucostoma TaxID=1230097 RepID=A0A423XGZ2_9PEZI|nr:hypothetical protein VPNG_02143 [Cytospora leucostoma]